MEIKSGRKILIIDDEEALLKNIGDFLKILGYDVFTSPNSSNGLELLRNHKPELLLLDLHLKDGITGIEVLRAAKMLKPDLKIVISSGFGEEEEIKKSCFSFGANAFLSKPTSLKILSETIKNILEVK
ncbi:MAG: response regulator [Candidatus Omnitrophica bacterium]|nr:response regulator [Candidatus Omnitrophota bacterium]